MSQKWYLDYFPEQQAGVIRFTEGDGTTEARVVRDAQGRIERTITTPGQRREAVVLMQNVPSFKLFQAAADDFARKLRADETLAAKFAEQLRGEL